QMTERGWVHEEQGGLTYHAPDASALLSPEFMEQHCFGAEVTESRILLRFAPNSARQRIPEIQGEVSLDRGTHRLERLTYDYVSLPLPRAASGHAGGEVSFAVAPNGLWLVTEWWIRMPVVTERSTRFGGSTVSNARVSEIREQGGRILRIRSGREVVDVTAPPPG
ncbi:MAG TPA: hypothetical protein VLA09_12135, partial [Longimicrobiales bacterium]|nr:hypothetical protein [Longimicrobiales bacterium]